MIGAGERGGLLPMVDVHCHQVSDLALSVLNIDGRDFSGKPDNTGRFFSLGVHPWFIAQQDWQQSLMNIAGCQDEGWLAIGECGLDAVIETPMPLQIEVFAAQIALAEQLQKPLIVHGVRSFQQLLALRKSYAVRQPWIIHGFRGKLALAHQWVNQGCYLSLGAALLKPESPVRQVLHDIPLQFLFLETDNAAQSIGEIYQVAAKILGLCEAELRLRIYENFVRVFPHV